MDDAGKPQALIERLSAEQAQEETRKLNAFLDSIIDNIPAMVFVKDAEHLRYELFNRAGEAMSGFKREDIFGKSPRDLFPPEQAEFFMGKDRAVLRDGKMLDIPEEPINTPAGKRWLHTKKIPILGPDGTPSHLLGISLDITERKAAQDALAEAHRQLEQRVAVAEDQLRQAQKLEAVGRLAGGVAHDFNNLLSVILSYAALLERENSPVSPAQAAQQIRKASERAALLTRQLLAFSRQQVLAPRVLNLNEVVRNVSELLRRLIGEDVRLVVAPEPELWHTRIDASQLEQVLMNLVVNARDAMPGGGELTLSTGNLEVLPNTASPPDGVPPGDWVVLRVRDTGVGMDPQTAARVFEPFFTTKHQSRGTGLGLSTVYGIVKQSGGHIAFDSAPGQGTTFNIYLARTLDRASTVPPDLPPASAPGSETLLLVEDDEQVRQVAFEVLKLQGYRVMAAASPREALELSAEFTGRIDLLVSDVVMPEMSGSTLAERLRQTRPDLAVLYMSGYADRALDKAALAQAAFLQKPVTPDLLTNMVRTVLDARRRRPT